MVRPEDIELSVPTESVCFIIIKARQFEAKEATVVSDEGSNPSDDRMVEVLEARSDDPVFDELTGFINAMSEDEQIELVALAWVGRGDYDVAEWEEAREEARNAFNGRTAEYLLGLPLIADYLDDALSALGRSCEDVEAQHL